MIPKKIYYVWLGGSQLPNLCKKCIESWKLYAPEYEIVKLDEANSYFPDKFPRWVSDAYNDGKYAFASDYIRIKTLYENGGWYMDTDVEMVKPFLDVYSHERFVTGVRTRKDDGFVNGFNFDTCLQTACFGAEAKHNICKATLDLYNSEAFRKYYNRTRMRYYRVLHVPLIQEIMSKVAEEHGFDYEVKDAVYADLKIVSNLCLGKRLVEKMNALSVHHAMNSWGEITKEQQHNFANKIGRDLLKEFEFNPWQ